MIMSASDGRCYDTDQPNGDGTFAEVPSPRGFGRNLQVVQTGERGRFYVGMTDVTAEARFLESCPEAILGFEFGDAYLHVAVSNDLLVRIKSRVGRAGDAKSRGRVWSLVP